MDSTKNRWAWLPAAMPGVARLMAEKRAKLGPAHVAECWQRGVIKQEPGWFFAREGSLAVGTPWADPMMANFAAASVTSTQALLILREPGSA
jgi:hypothetical protein